MAGFIIAKLLEKVPQVDFHTIEDVMVGCGLTHHEAGYNLGRNAALLPGLPVTVPGTTVNRFCSSSLQTIRMAAHAIKAGEGDIFVAAGAESITRTLNKGFDPEDFNPRFVDESRDDFINHVYIPMGMTAENVAERYGISRERMDEFGKLSQDRAVAAQADGFFDREITPYPLPDGTFMTKDDGPRPNTCLLYTSPSPR